MCSFFNSLWPSGRSASYLLMKGLARTTYVRAPMSEEDRLLAQIHKDIAREVKRMNREANRAFRAAGRVIPKSTGNPAARAESTSIPLPPLRDPGAMVPLPRLDQYEPPIYLGSRPAAIGANGGLRGSRATSRGRH